LVYLLFICKFLSFEKVFITRVLNLNVTKNSSTIRAIIKLRVIKKFKLFKLVTLDRILNRITGVTSGCWWLVLVNAIPISDICQINQQNISSCSVLNNRIKTFSQLYCQIKQSFLITRYFPCKGKSVTNAK
jgi:MFS-type transporter involved in bile tolerance (Atg22 family)